MPSIWSGVSRRWRRVLLAGAVSVVLAPMVAPAGAAAADPTTVERGAVIYRGGTCPVCHHWEGQGNRRGPDLTDEEWLHGDGSLAAVRTAIETGFRHGTGRRFRGKYEMWPLGGMELDESDVDALTAYVWSLHRRRRAADTLTREVVSRIAIGSGADQNRAQPVWDTVLALRPQLTLMLGNNILAGTEDMQELRLQYDKLTAKPGFAELRRQSRFMATWNDLDFGREDGGADFDERAESQQVFLDFWNEPSGSPRRHQQGVYTSQRFGPPGRRLQVILLDTRYGRGPLWQVSPEEARRRQLRGMGPYLPNDHERARMLSEEQWRWLEQQLRQPADLRLIVTSIPFVMEFSGWESWANMPNERQRLIDLIRDTGATGVLLLSGDSPWADISRLDGVASYPLWDFTTGPLNRRSTTGIGPNRHRVGQATRESNFGYIEIDWTAADPGVRVEVRNVANRGLLRQTLRLSELQPK
ncbi:MAG: c-type cytochrome [Holophagales bacterium]|nr:c-type cytochrome [Holophagales bacterium]MYD23618.1 c-type cytochrome [Holophagales bacterium]MYI33866.1 c-type cytochrome [Holophagales bacterium]